MSKREGSLRAAALSREQLPAWMGTMIWMQDAAYVVDRPEVLNGIAKGKTPAGRFEIWVDLPSWTVDCDKGKYFYSNFLRVLSPVERTGDKVLVGPRTLRWRF